MKKTLIEKLLREGEVSRIAKSVSNPLSKDVIGSGSQPS